MSLILASGSPRRRELLSLITTDFTVKVSNAEEKTGEGLSPAETVEALAEIKGEAVFSLYPNDTVIASDTVVSIGGKILGKPHSPEEAFLMLSSLSGKTHTVYTGVYIKNASSKTVFSERTEVTFYELSGEEINGYIKTGEPFDKAGAYGIQGPGAVLVKCISGDYYNVMGFPIGRINRELKKFSI
ncbi:MAG: septum formation inhibitor Maf [Oscillospiraceae bacterium]|nr:septum formation inhibitor Maf [Oscillospiraceae bacterium]